MISILSKLFLKEPIDYKDKRTRNIYGMLCGFLGVFLNLCLFLIKFIAGTISNSIAITADALNNLSDAGSSIITLIGFKLASQKPDSKHPFGHGRMEYISGLFVSIAILLMAYELFTSSIDKIKHPNIMQTSPLVIFILLISILIKLYMAYYNKSIGTKIYSTTLCAVFTDSISDTLATSLVLICSIISNYTGLNLDGYCGVVVALFIFYAGINACNDTINPLLGQPPTKEFIEQVESITLATHHVLGIHDLIVHNYGPGRTMLSLHVEVPADGDILEIHDEIDNLERKLKSTLDVHAVIHMDPISQNDPTTLALKESVTSIIKNINEHFSLHDFRIVTGNTHTNIIFDLVIPSTFTGKEEDLLDAIDLEIKKLNEHYYTVIEVDRDFT